MTDSIIVNGVKYVPESVVGGYRIIVADRGWVFVGECEDMPDGQVTIRNANCIRVWGTTRGLGELANGPTKDTKLDPCGTVVTKPIVTIASNKAAWVKP